jgi:hypothetical protein
MKQKKESQENLAEAHEFIRGRITTDDIWEKVKDSAMIAFAKDPNAVRIFIEDLTLAQQKALCRQFVDIASAKAVDFSGQKATLDTTSTTINGW